VFEDITPESIRQDILDNIQTGLDKREGSFLSDMVAPIAEEIWNTMMAMNSLIPIAFVDETSGKYIDKRAGEVGITRKPGTKAHVELNFTGASGTMVPKGTIFLTQDGLEYVTAADTALDESGATATADAVEEGEAYNVPAGSITNQYNSIAGLSAVTNNMAAEGGTDPETDKSLVDRYYAYLQKPATSGNVHHYEQWALEVDGVGAVKVTPLQDGPGTVGILIVGPQKQPVDANVVDACKAHIEANRPIGAAVTVKSAEGLTINVTASITIETSTTKGTVQTAFQKALDDYLKSIAFVNYTLLYNHIAFLLLGIDGVTDYTNLKVNGGTSNITIAENQVPVLGTVTVS